MITLLLRLVSFPFHYSSGPNSQTCYLDRQSHPFHFLSEHLHVVPYFPFHTRKIIKNIRFSKLKKLSSAMTKKRDKPMVGEHLLCKAVLPFQETHLALPFYSSLSILDFFWSPHYILILQVLSPGAKNENHIEITISATTLNWLSSGYVSILYWLAHGTLGPGVRWKQKWKNCSSFITLEQGQAPAFELNRRRNTLIYGHVIVNAFILYTFWCFTLETHCNPEALHVGKATLAIHKTCEKYY